MPVSNRAFLLIGAALIGGLVLVPGAPLSAQGRPVVQPLPPAATNDLNRALQRLATNPRDTDALILAGNASLELDDIDAAIGFFGRAEELSPGNPRVKAGTAAAYVRVRRPVEALRLFEESERAGVQPAAVAGDKGLAHDLVGNNLEAQLAYRQALAFEDSSEIRRRMALSYAIAGDSEGLESTLLPLLNEGDFAAYRTRAFGLAILGKPDEAVAIANAVMPKEMAERIEPYLRYMRRLTPAQQAAAGNLGIFPRASAIGRDDPRIAAVQSAGSSRAIAGVDSGLAPSGRPLGQSSASGAAQGSDGSLTRAQRQAMLAQRREKTAARRSIDRRVRVAQAAPVEALPAPAPTPAPAPIAPATPAEVPIERTVRGELPALARTDVPAVTVAIAPTIAGLAAAEQVATPNPAPGFAPVPVNDPIPEAVQLAQIEPPEADTSTAIGVEPVLPETRQAITEVAVAPSSVEPAQILPSAPAISTAVTVATLDVNSRSASPAPGFDLGDLSPEAVSKVDEVPATAVSPAAPPARSVSQAFADLMALPDASSVPAAANAVDITAIEIPREEATPEVAAAPPKPAAKPAAPANPSRIWVQVATGRDRSALRFDWRRFSRQAPDVLKDNGPYVASWGETNRLLAGPFKSQTDANAAIKALAATGIGAFRFTSTAGQAIDQLGN